VLDVFGAVLLVGGIVRKRVKEASEEAMAHRGFNAQLDIALAHQIVDAKAGAFLLVLGFIGQFLVAVGWNPNGKDGVVIAVAAAGAFAWVVCVFLTVWLYWRPRRAKKHFSWRLEDDNPNSWSRIMDMYRPAFGDPREDETYAEYGRRVLGDREWQRITQDRELPDYLDNTWHTPPLEAGEWPAW